MLDLDMENKIDHSLQLKEHLILKFVKLQSSVAKCCKISKIYSIFTKFAKFVYIYTCYAQKKLSLFSRNSRQNVPFFAHNTNIYKIHQLCKGQSSTVFYNILQSNFTIFIDETVTNEYF